MNSLTAESSLKSGVSTTDLGDSKKEWNSCEECLSTLGHAKLDVFVSISVFKSRFRDVGLFRLYLLVLLGVDGATSGSLS